jgi:putative Mg2+ transporter-C (MgtC) family protein
MDMPLHLDLWDGLLRLLLAGLAGGILGFDRGRRGHAAGLRTTVLVSLAAAIAMTQANALLPLDGKGAAGFSVFDVGRFPLGILTGVGFIGGGTILKRGDLVTGVTTAATLWIATTIGLCFGGGQWMLGILGTMLGAVTLLGLRRVDELIPRRRKAGVTIVTPGPASIPASELALVVGCAVVFRGHRGDGDKGLSTYELDWQARDERGAEEMLNRLTARFEVASFELQPESDH